MSLRILHITAEALRGGCEKNCFHFVKGDSTDSHSIIVLGTRGPMSDDWEALKIPVYHLNILSRNLWSFKRSLQNFLSAASYDLCICWSTVRLPLQLSALSGIARQIKVYLGNPVGPNYNSTKDVLLTQFFRQPSRVVLMACSEYVKSSHEADRYFKRHPVRVSLNPVALPASLRTDREQMPGHRAGMVARLDPIKDHATVIRGFVKVLASFPSAELHIIGDGRLKDNLIQLASELGITNSVKFHGDVKDVYTKLNDLHIFVYATTPQEGLGSAVAEAMANGLPCVLSDLPMLRELSPTNETAEWFRGGDADDYANKLISLFGNFERRRTLAKAAFDHAQKNFGVQRFIEDYVND